MHQVFTCEHRQVDIVKDVTGEVVAMICLNEDCGAQLEVSTRREVSR